jgi:cell division protease FtsH
MLNKVNGAGSKAMSFGKSRARFIDPSAEKTTFKDVAGCKEEKEELMEVVEFLKSPKKFQKLGGKIPKGVLLVGPPGTGKTLLARAVAGEAKVPFLHISGSDFVEMFVGVGASRVRDLFEQAKKRKPCIVFIDEIDAVGRQRGAGLGGGHDEREQTLNQLLVEMDGFEANSGIVVMAATNRPDILDPALLRPGRFDRQIVVDLPDIKGRYEILKVHTRKVPLDDSVDLEVIAKTTPGLAGADLANLVNEAALLAARNGRDKVTAEDFENARDKITMGVERKSKVISEEEKEITAYHEAGHTIIAKLIKDCDPLHKVTIIPRGRALGVTHSIPEKDRYLYSKEQFLALIKKAMGGRCAEELKFNLISTGASNDISVATNIAHNMVCVYGMSEKFGPISFGKREQHIFLGKEIAQIKDYSEKTAYEIDMEVRKIIISCYEETKNLIKENMDKLESIAQALLKYETLTNKQVDMLMEGKGIDEIEENGDKETKSDDKNDNENKNSDEEKHINEEA